jgi:NADH-quinone oxidoreductase subunit M
MIYERYHTRDINAFGGLWIRMPILAFFLIVAALGSAAVPGLNGFTGEFPILVGAFNRSPRAGTLAATGMVLGACYLLWMLRKVLFGPLKEPLSHEAHGAGDLVHSVAPVGAHEIAGLAPLMFLIVAIGVYPRPILEQMKPTVMKISGNTEVRKAAEVSDVSAEPANTAQGDEKASPARSAGGPPAQPESLRHDDQSNPTSSLGKAASRTKDQETHS